ncbi:RNA polymerase sigma factor [Lysinibacillus sphaericus]
MIFDNIDNTMSRLYRFCLKQTGSPWAAEDLVQETLTKVYSLKTMDPEREFTISFLYKVANNLFIDELRKKKAVTGFREELYQFEEDFISCEGLVEELMMKLPIRQAVLITLKDVFSYRSQEIAEMLRISDESVKTALSRSRSRLKSMRDYIPPIRSSPRDHELISELTLAIKHSRPASLFTLCRLLESRQFETSRHSGTRRILLCDPDGNILEIVN